MKELTREEQIQYIQNLLDGLCKIQDAIGDDGSCELKVNDVAWCNEAYDQIQVGFLEEAPDGDYQNQLFDEGYKLSFDEARAILLTRIYNSLQTIGFISYQETYSTTKDEVICLSDKPLTDKQIERVIEIYPDMQNNEPNEMATVIIAMCIDMVLDKK